MGPSETETDDTEMQNPVWETAFVRFGHEIFCGPDPIRVRAIMKLADVADEIPDDVLSGAIPVLVALLRVRDDPDLSVQISAAYCLKRIACRGSEEGTLALKMGMCGVFDSLLKLSLDRNGHKFLIVWVKCLWSLVTFERLNRVLFARRGGLGFVLSALGRQNDANTRRYLLEILSALSTIRETMQIMIQSGDLKLLVEAVQVGSLASRERACHTIGLLSFNRNARRMLVESGAIPVLVDLLREGDDRAKILAANTLGVVSAHVDYIRLMVQAGAVPLLFELLPVHEHWRREMVGDVISILAVDETNAALIGEYFVKGLRQADDKAKIAVSYLLWDLVGCNHTASVFRNCCAIPLLKDLLRYGSSKYRNLVSTAIGFWSNYKHARDAFVLTDLIPVLVEWLSNESRSFRDAAEYVLINLSEDRDHYAKVRDALGRLVLPSTASGLGSIRYALEQTDRSLSDLTCSICASEDDE